MCNRTLRCSGSGYSRRTASRRSRQEAVRTERDYTAQLCGSARVHDDTQNAERRGGGNRSDAAPIVNYRANSDPNSQEAAPR